MSETAGLEGIGGPVALEEEEEEEAEEDDGFTGFEFAASF